MKNTDNKKDKKITSFSLVVQAAYILIWTIVTVFMLPWIVRTALTPLYAMIYGYERGYIGMYIDEKTAAIVMDPGWYDFYTVTTVFLSTAFGLLAMWTYFNKFHTDLITKKMLDHERSSRN